LEENGLLCAEGFSPIKTGFWDAWVPQSVKRLPSAQVIILESRNQDHPALGSPLSREAASPFMLSPPLE